LANESSNLRINREINCPRVRLVGPDGQQIGIIPTREAMMRADELELDLVEIAPTADPPVCSLMDYGKFKYPQDKKASEARKKQKQIQVKEVKFRPFTDDADFQVKLRNLIRFLNEGDKGKVTIRFRGREMEHANLAHELLGRLEAELAEHAVVESRPQMEGRQMVMVFAPKRRPVAAVKTTETVKAESEGG